MADDDKIQKRDSDDLDEPERDEELAERATWLRGRVPHAMEVIDSGRAVVPHQRYVLAVNELFARLNPFGSASRQDIDDTLGEGMSDLIDHEADMPDGGIFGSGGVTAGGIFGDQPVATNLNDPAAEQRAASVEATRGLLGDGDAPRSKLPTQVRKALPSEKRDRLLRGPGSDE
jgi:hypothetical protein